MSPDIGKQVVVTGSESTISADDVVEYYKKHHVEDEFREEAFSKRKNWTRNLPCPCESGKKFKKCCWSKR